MEEKIKFKMHKFEMVESVESFGIVNFEARTDNDTFIVSHKLDVNNNNDLQLLIDIENYIRKTITESTL